MMVIMIIFLTHITMRTISMIIIMIKIKTI
jgi:hypothetical protein